jgi:hypothetical protein
MGYNFFNFFCALISSIFNAILDIRSSIGGFSCMITWLRNELSNKS